MKKIYTLLTGLILVSTGMAQWVQKASLPADQRHHPVNFTLDGKGFLLTGVNTSNQLLRDFYSYDPSNDSWTKLTDFPGAARGFAYGLNYDGKGYIGFGITQTSYLNDLWRFDPSDSSWTPMASCPCAGRRHPALIATAGKIMVGLGDGAAGNLADWWVYDVATNTWSQAPNLPGPGRHHPYYFAIGDYAYVGFGHAGQNIYKDFYRFDPSNNTWTTLNLFPGEARVAGQQNAYGGKGYLLGGDGSDHRNLDTGEFWEYDPTNDSWTQLTAYPGQGRWASGSFVIDHTIYLMAGETGNLTLHNDMYSYELPDAYVGMEEQSKPESRSLNIYPNPVDNFIQLPDHFASKGNLEVSVLNMSGQEIATPVSQNGTIYVDQLPSQFYVLVIRDREGSVYTGKFLKN